MRANRARDTGPELRLRSALHRRGLRFFVDRPPLKGIRRRADIVFPRLRIAVYVDGCFWHGCPIHGTWPKRNAAFWRDKIETNRRRDADTDRRLVEVGWAVVRVWEHEAVDQAVERVAATVKERRRSDRDSVQVVDESAADHLSKPDGHGIADQPAKGTEVDRIALVHERVVARKGLEDRGLAQ